MAEVIMPVAQPLMLCEEIDVEGGMVNAYALFNAMHAPTFPFRRELFCVFAQLRGGLGSVTAHYDIVRARDEQLIHMSHARQLHFARRTELIQFSTRFEKIVFDEPGVYFVQLFCENTMIADVVLEILEGT